MRWLIVVSCSAAMMVFAWLYFATPESGQPVDVRAAYVVGIYFSAAAALLSIVLLRKRQ